MAERLAANPVVGLLALLLITACGAEAPGNAAQSFSGQTGYGGVSTELLASAPTQTELVPVGRGTLANDGSFTFVLDTDLPLTILVAQPPLCPELEERLVLVEQLNALRGSELVGDLVQASSAEHARGSADGAKVVRVYAERTVSAQGRCGDISYDLELSRGWNLVRLVTEKETFSYTSGNSSLDWFFIGAD